MEGISNKCTLEEIEELSVGAFATAPYGIATKKACNGNFNEVHQVESA